MFRIHLISLVIIINVSHILALYPEKIRLFIKQRLGIILSILFIVAEYIKSLKSLSNNCLQTALVIAVSIKHQYFIQIIKNRCI